MRALLSGLGNWLDDRTGYRRVVHEALYENIPGGSRWIYVTGSMLLFAFATQVVTGVFLWMGYSPGSQNAWESVYWIENHWQGGWLLRGLHHSMSQAMVVLLPVHLLQILLWRAYIKPREVNYWLGLVLMLLVLALGLTGYLLPWDQKGYWATKVATELMSLVPGGGSIQRLVVGGREYGHYTLTRFFALHAGVLPALLVLVLALHVAMFRRHGITAKSRPWRPDEYFWPRQALKDAAACLVLLAVVLGYVVWARGAELGPPAEPTESYGAARPEWYYLFLFQLLKWTPNELLGAVVIPTAVMVFLFLMPFLGRILLGHVLNVACVITLLVAAGYLTFEAWDHDRFALKQRAEPQQPAARQLHLERTEASRQFLLAKARAEHEYERVSELVEFYGIPRQGVAASLVRNDPEIQGPRMFLRNCASCHSYLDEHGVGIPGPQPPRDAQGELIPDPPPYGAPNLYGIGSRPWFLKILNPATISGNDRFGLTNHKQGEMVQFVGDELSDLDEEQSKRLHQIVDVLSAEAQLLYERDANPQTVGDDAIQAGRAVLAEAIDARACTDCHKFHDMGELGMAPDLTGYASYRWLYDFIANPAHERFYAADRNDRMPAFALDPEDQARNLLTHHQVDMLVRWLRRDTQDLTRVQAIAGPEANPPE